MSKWTVCGKMAGLFLKEKGSGDLNQEMGGWMEREWTRATLSVHTKTLLHFGTLDPADSSVREAHQLPPRTIAASQDPSSTPQHLFHVPNSF